MWNKFRNDIIAEFHGPFAGSAPSCSSSESARKLTTSASYPSLAQRLLFWSLVTVGLLNIKLYDGLTLCTHVWRITFRITTLLHNDIIVPSQCYNIVVLWSPWRYRKSRSYDSGPSFDDAKVELEAGQLLITVWCFCCSCNVDWNLLVCHWNIHVVCCGFSAMQSQLAQQHDTIKEMEEKISFTTSEMMKVYCWNFSSIFFEFVITVHLYTKLCSPCYS